jgi:hypothetical protein
VTGARRPLLAVLLGSIAFNAALGIYALLTPHFGGLQEKVLGTSACVTAAGVLTFACLPALEQRRARFTPLLGIGASLLGFSLAIGAIWAGGSGETFGKTMGSVFVVAVFAVLTSVLSLARLASRYRLVLTAAVALAFALGALIVGAMWGDPSGSWYPRLVGVVAVLLAAATLAVPILHRASRSEPAPAPAPAGVRFCPSCGAPVALPASRESTCGSCGIRFRVDYPGSG